MSTLIKIITSLITITVLSFTTSDSVKADYKNKPNKNSKSNTKDVTKNSDSKPLN